MISNAIKLLFVSVAVMCFTTRAQKINAFLCPFDCTKVCVERTNHFDPITQKYVYQCSREISECCNDGCKSYQQCLLSNEEYVCYAETLDYMCNCRKLGSFKVDTKGK